MQNEEYNELVEINGGNTANMLGLGITQALAFSYFCISTYAWVTYL